MKKTIILISLIILLAVPCNAEKGLRRKGNVEKRLALVIGNSDYKTAPLKNPVNDARDMSEMLQSLGFDVIYRANASQKQMEDAVFQFGKTLRRGGVGLFYFSGHGVQVEGRNYLLPVDARIESESDVKFESVDAGRVLGKMKDAGNRLNVVILDACRNNPFARSFRSANQGLARMDAPKGSLIAYATAPNSVAADGDGRNGTYTKYLLEHMKEPSLIIEKVFKNVRNDVLRETGGKQTPWESTSLTGGDFYFAASGEATVVTPIPGPKPAAYASLTVRPDAPGAVIYLDGKRLGEGALKIERLKPGTHTLRVEKQGYHVWEKQITLQAGEASDKRVYLEKIVVEPVVKPVVSETAVSLRSTPETLSDKDVKDLMKKYDFFDRYDNPSGDFKNDFAGNGDGTVTDRATGLMWQKGGSSDSMVYKDAEAYINSLNRENFAGYDDWRLPTLPELASLLKSREVNGLYIDPIFDKRQAYCWTSDQRSSGSAWDVLFLYGGVSWHGHDDYYYVRAVRRGQ